MIAALFVKLHLAASLLMQCIYVANISFSFFVICIKWLMDVWISELQIFNLNMYLMSLHPFPDVRASVINAWASPFDLAWLI